VYGAAISYLNEGRMEEARGALSKFIGTYPKHELISSARLDYAHSYVDEARLNKGRLNKMLLPIALSEYEKIKVSYDSDDIDDERPRLVDNMIRTLKERIAEESAGTKKNR